MNRSMNRSILKKKYEDFCQAWRDEKLYQRVVLDSGAELPQGTYELGKKPTFKMWVQAMKNQKSAQVQVPENSVSVDDTSWDE